MVVLGAALVFFLATDRHDSLIVLFMMIVVLGDSRQGWLLFSKPLRVEMLVVFTLYTFYELSKRKYSLNALFAPFFLFLFISIIALAFNPKLDLAINKTLSFGMLYFFALHYMFDKLRKYGSSLIDDAMYLSHFILALGLILLPVYPDLVSYGGIRYNGLLGNPNGMGMYVTLTLPITVYVFSKRPNISKRYRTFAFAVIFLSLFLCSSRNAIFSVTIFMTLYYGLSGNLFRRLLVFGVLFPAMGIIIFNIDLESLVISLGLGKYFRVQEFSSGSGRIFAWRHAIEIIKEHPIIGCGFACEEYLFIYRTSRELWITGHQGGVHNSYLAFIINTGIVGLSIYMGFLVNIFRKITQIKFLLAYLTSAAFLAMFESWLFSSLSAFHILFLVLIMQLLADRYVPNFKLRT